MVDTTITCRWRVSYCEKTSQASSGPSLTNCCLVLPTSSPKDSLRIGVLGVW